MQEVCPKGLQKIIWSRKFTPRVSPKKLKTLFVTGKNDVLKTISQIFLWECEIPLVTNLLICNTRQTLVEWDFSTTNKTTKVDMQTKVGPLWTGAPSDKFSWALAQWECYLSLCFKSPSCCVAARHSSMLASSSWWWPEIVFLPVEEPSSQDKEQDERKTLSWLRFSSSWKMTQRTDNVSQWPSLEGKGINRKEECL